MKALHITLLSLVLAAPLCVAEQGGAPLAGEGSGVDVSQPADKVLRQEGWELQIWYRAKGTRSEGQHGVLLQNGKEIPPGNVGDEMDTALGKMKYYGATPGVLWDPSGWHFADKSLIKPSTFCP
jgi:hypothetical protein